MLAVNASIRAHAADEHTVLVAAVPLGRGGGVAQDAALDAVLERRGGDWCGAAGVHDLKLPVVVLGSSGHTNERMDLDASDKSQPIAGLVETK